MSGFDSRYYLNALNKLPESQDNPFRNQLQAWMQSVFISGPVLGAPSASRAPWFAAHDFGKKRPCFLVKPVSAGRSCNRILLAGGNAPVSKGQGRQESSFIKF